MSYAYSQTCRPTVTLSSGSAAAPAVTAPLHQIGAAVLTTPATDALQRRYAAELAQFPVWLAIGSTGAPGIVEECGVTSADATWLPVLETYLSKADELGLPILGWGSGATMHTDNMAIHTVTTTEWWNNVLNTANAQAATFENHFGNARSGVNLVGPIFGYGGNLVATGGAISNANPGSHGADYKYPSAGDWAFLAGRGASTVRLHVLWERLQPTLGAALAAAEVDLLEQALTDAAAAGISVSVSPYNGSGYTVLDRGSATRYFPGDGTVSEAHFTQFWSRMTTALTGHAGLLSFGLVNEPSPNGHTVAGTALNRFQYWEYLSQLAVDAIRAVDATLEVWVPGVLGASPWDLTNWHAAGPWIKNLARSAPDTHIRYATHHYPDGTGTTKNAPSGGGGSFRNSYAACLAAAVTAGY